MRVIPISLEPYGCNCYILVDDTGECAVVDPGCMGDEICDYMKRENISPKLILLTHGHVDHVGGVNKIKHATGAKTAMCVEDIYLTTGDPDSLPSGFPSLGADECFVPDIPLSTGDVIDIGNTQLRVIKTPGHTPGGACFFSGDILFSGDTLFRGSVGRTDFKGGDAQDIMKSLHRLLELPDNTAVYPGHGEITSIAQEKRYNGYIRGEI